MLTFPNPQPFRYNQISAGHPHGIAPLAQLDRASGYEPEGREFESLRAHHFSQPFTLIFLIASAGGFWHRYTGAWLPNAARSVQDREHPDHGRIRATCPPKASTAQMRFHRDSLSNEATHTTLSTSQIQPVYGIAWLTDHQGSEAAAPR